MRINSLYKIIITFCVGLLFTSCSENVNKVYLNQIDDLSKQIEQSSADLNDASRDSIFIIYKQIENTLSYFKKNINETIPDSVVLRNFSKYSVLKKIIKKQVTDLTQLKEEFDLSESQLKNLHKDVKNNLLKIDEIEKYISDEKQIVIQLTTQVKPLVNSMEQNMILFYELQPIMEELNKNINKQ